MTDFVLTLYLVISIITISGYKIKFYIVDAPRWRNQDYNLIYIR